VSSGGEAALIPGHEAFELLLEAQALHAVHSVQVDAAVQVVALVLDHARVEARRFDAERAALAVQRLEPQPLPARHQPAQLRDRQAAFPARGALLAERRELGVDQHGQRHRPAGALVGGRYLQHGQPQPDVDLRRGQSHAVVLVHRLDHVVDQPLELEVRDPVGRDALGRRPHDWVSDAGDLQNHL
jgi:hypothetical protein